MKDEKTPGQEIIQTYDLGLALGRTKDGTIAFSQIDGAHYVLDILRASIVPSLMIVPVAVIWSFLEISNLTFIVFKENIILLHIDSFVRFLQNVFGFSLIRSLLSRSDFSYVPQHGLAGFLVRRAKREDRSTLDSRNREDKQHNIESLEVRTFSVVYYSIATIAANAQETIPYFKIDPKAESHALQLASGSIATIQLFFSFLVKPDVSKLNADAQTALKPLIGSVNLEAEGIYWKGGTNSHHIEKFSIMKFTNGILSSTSNCGRV
ncbi:hypothetical protein Pfo_014887 [Paulownia fortunei]|nr:hypothetical protein Pfo_014887 [Paulownia fortunei]